MYFEMHKDDKGMPTENTPMLVVEEAEKSSKSPSMQRLVCYQFQLNGQLKEICIGCFLTNELTERAQNMSCDNATVVFFIDYNTLMEFPTISKE